MRHACRALAYHGISQSDWHAENLLVEASPGDRPTISVVMVDFGLVDLRQKFIDATGSEALLPFPKWNDRGAKRLLMGYEQISYPALAAGQSGVSSYRLLKQV